MDSVRVPESVKGALTPASTVSKPRMSANEKAYQQYADMLGISVERAKAELLKQMQKETGAQCTCAVTPGICKVHP